MKKWSLWAITHFQKSSATEVSEIVFMLEKVKSLFLLFVWDGLWRHWSCQCKTFLKTLYLPIVKPQVRLWKGIHVVSPEYLLFHLMTEKIELYPYIIIKYDWPGAELQK